MHKTSNKEKRVTDLHNYDSRNKSRKSRQSTSKRGSTLSDLSNTHRYKIDINNHLTSEIIKQYSNREEYSPKRTLSKSSNSRNKENNKTSAIKYQKKRSRSRSRKSSRSMKRYINEKRFRHNYEDKSERRNRYKSDRKNDEKKTSIDSSYATFQKKASNDRYTSSKDVEKENKSRTYYENKDNDNTYNNSSRTYCLDEIFPLDHISQHSSPNFAKNKFDLTTTNQSPSYTKRNIKQRDLCLNVDKDSDIIPITDNLPNDNFNEIFLNLPFKYIPNKETINLVEQINSLLCKVGESSLPFESFKSLLDPVNENLIKEALFYYAKLHHKCTQCKTKEDDEIIKTFNEKFIYSPHSEDITSPTEYNTSGECLQSIKHNDVLGKKSIDHCSRISSNTNNPYLSLTKVETKRDSKINLNMNDSDNLYL